MIRPEPVRPGDTLGMIGISGCVHKGSQLEELEKAVRKFESYGYRVKVDPSCEKQWGFLSGTDRERADAFNRMAADDQIRGIVCFKGGYGTVRILPMLDYALFARRPRVFLGFSDITLVHLALQKETSICTLHGPMGTSHLLEGKALESLQMALAGKPLHFMENPDGSSLQTLREGDGEGILTGGNLSVLAASLGTPWAVEGRDRILFLEELDEPSYRVDFYLHHLMLAGVFEHCRGIILGRFTDCRSEYPDTGFTTDEILQQFADSVSVPVIAGLHAGHVDQSLTLPLGRRFRICARTSSASMELVDDD